MLARVTSGKTGVVEYLVSGMKSGRSFERDELDERVIIDGNLKITDELIKQLNLAGRSNNYLHVTLSFGERDLSEETIISAYQDYKSKLMSAYDDSEYHMYAEIHYPKIKSYVNGKTGETVERLPHVHIVLPQKNLVTDKALDPFGRYTSNIDFHDAIQESVNRRLELLSPYDNQRPHSTIKDGGEFISRYKGDTFSGNKAEFKGELFDLINDKDIRSMAEFERLLSTYGEVSKGKKGATDEYLKVKLFGESRNVRLTNEAFKPAYIENRQLLREKPTDKKINRLVDQWIKTKSHEAKLIHPAAPKLRKEYYDLNPHQKEEFLNERRRGFNRQNGLEPSRRAASPKLGSERIGLKQFADIGNGLPSLPQRGLDAARGERRSGTKSVLPDHANDNLEPDRADRNHKLRRLNDDRRGGRRAEGRLTQSTGIPTGILSRAGSRRTGLAKSRLKLVVNNVPPDKASTESLSERLLRRHVELKTSKEELKYFRGVRRNLDPERLLRSFSESHGLVAEHYTTSKARDGSARIKIGGRAYNVSDFSTQHMRQSWDETKLILSKCYSEQCAAKEERSVVNSISFVSRYITESYSTESKLSRLDESLMILKYLQSKENHGDKEMSLAELKKYKVAGDKFEKNSISNSEPDLATITNNLKRQREMADQLTLKMSDLVATKDMKKKRVDFRNMNTGDKVFTDTGHKLIMASRKPEPKDVAAAMTLAAEKFGTVKISGTQEFKQQVLDVAVAKDLKIVFESPKMQVLFMKYKEEKATAAELERIDKAEEVKTSSTDKAELKASTTDKAEVQDETVVKKPEVITLIAHGAAPYLHKKGGAESYYTELSNGETKWGVGLKDAIKDSGAQVGDSVHIERAGSREVLINAPIKDDEGKTLGFEEKTVQRADWKVDVLEAKANDDLPVSKKAQYDVNYQWSKEDSKTIITINDKSPQGAPVAVLEKIIKNDRFLKNYTMAQVLSGKLDLSLANGAQPVPKQYDGKGVVLAERTTQEPVKLKH